jgi:hypothetical protein
MPHWRRTEYPIKWRKRSIGNDGSAIARRDSACPQSSSGSQPSIPTKPLPLQAMLEDAATVAKAVKPINDLAASVKRGVVEAGMVGMRFNKIVVSDGISMGSDGMSYSLLSRDLIADSIEAVTILRRSGVPQESG